MRRNLRTPLSLVVLIIAVFGIFWVSKQSVTEKPLASVPIVSHDHEHVIPDLEPVVVDPELMDGFQSWMTAFRAGERGEAFMNQGLALAEERRSTMLELIQRDASLALTHSISYADYASLPEEIKAIVEEPFTLTGDVLVTAICDHEFHTPDYKIDIFLEDESRLKVTHPGFLRSGLSKLDIPIQGIQLDGYAAVRNGVFDRLEGADVDWAWVNLPTGNPDPNLDFLTGEPLGFNPITAVAGGFSFLFSDEETLTQLEAVLSEFDYMAGKSTGSSVIFSQLVQSQAKGFPIEVIRESQMQILLSETTGAKTTIFIRTTYLDKPETPLSKEDLENQINLDVSGHLADFSYGKTTMTATATADTYEFNQESSQYTFNGANGTVDTNAMMVEAIALYEEAGSPEGALNGFDIVGIIFPKLDGWGSVAGLGTLGGANSQHWLNGTPSTETIVHEFGHNYGLPHSNYWVFNKNEESTNPVQPKPIGDNEEYGDLWDVMGDGDVNRGHFHMAAKNYLQWLNDDDVRTIESPEDSGTYVINRFDHMDATGLQGLRIKKSDDDSNYWIGFRRAFESNANYYNGAYILWELPGSLGGNPGRQQGWIIDTTPESEGERQDAGISLGRTYSDTSGDGVHITPISVGGGGANTTLEVVVNFGEFSGNAAPTLSIDVPANGEARTSIALSANGSDGDGDTLAYSWDLGDGKVYHSTSSINAVYTVGGTFDVAVTVTDMKGGTATETDQIVIFDPVNTWSARTSGTTNDLEGLGTDGTHVFAVGRGAILRSSDGQAYTNVAPGGSLNTTFNDIVWTGSEWIAIGMDAEFQGGSFFGWKPVIFSSPDGTTWSQDFEAPANAGNSLYGFNKVATNEDGSIVMVVGEQDLVYKRIDDGDWTKEDSLGISTSTDLGIAYGNGLFILGGLNFDNVSDGLYLFRTSDGTNWENLRGNSDLNPNGGIDEIAFLDGIFVGSGFNIRTVFSQNGGLSWQTIEQGDTFTESEAFAFGSGVFYAIGEQYPEGNAFNTSPMNQVSSNGKAWQRVDDAVEQVGNDVIFFKNSFIIIGDGGSILQSGLVEAADEVLAAPVISPASPTFSSTVNVTITTGAESATIHYTADGSEPNVGSEVYSEPIVISETTTVKAKVFKGDLDPSPTASVTYTKTLSGFDSWIESFSVGGEDGAADNPDGDWALNLLERAVGSAPDDGDSAPAAPVMSIDGSGKIVFKISRLSKSDDVALSIEKSSNLKDWTVLETEITDETEEMLILTSDEALAFVPCFLRVKAVE
ncbi:MAG: chitobiase/beta-hexosaminidase C-terminal domain-containing protein [Opitutales bacterium]|nr:chitobiase/beta-hexosaminidase C-terminal domain-containing protein [Opitutales bacterium]